MTPQELIKKAEEARLHSYSPYSGFKVGAALLCSDGTVYTGCNIENASFTPTICAERTAIFKAVYDGRRDFTAIAIVGGKYDGSDTSRLRYNGCLDAMHRHGVAFDEANDYVGGRFSYKRYFFNLGEFDLNLGDDFNIGLKDLYYLQHNYESTLFVRSYLPLGNSKIFGLFGEFQLNYTFAEGKNSTGRELTVL